MTDPTAERLENLSIQDNDVSTGEFDPYSAGFTSASGQDENVDQQQISNGLEPMSVEQIDFGPYTKHIEGQERAPGKQLDEGLGRKMSEREMLGYQNDYGGTFQSSAQMEYIIDSDEDDRNNFVEMGAAAQPPTTGEEQYYIQTGQPLIDVGDAGVLSSDNQPFSPESSQITSDGYLGSPDGETFDSLSPDTAHGAGVGNVQNMDLIDPENWAPHVSPSRARRSRSPERSLSPPAHGHAWEGGDPQQSPDHDMELESNGKVKDSKPHKKEVHRVGHIPRLQGSPKVTRAKKPLELPPWNDNVVIPPPPRMKPTLIGKQTEVVSPSRPKTAPSTLQYRRADASSDSGVEEDKGSRKERKASADPKKKYGIDSKNVKYKPGGGNIKIFNEKVDTATVGPRTDAKPRAVESPRGSVSSDKSPMTTKLPSPNVKKVQSKIGSLDNARHSPGGGNVKVLSSKVDYSNVGSKVGSKDKIDHKPKGGDKKIQTAKLNWSAESKVGSLKNASHSPGGGTVKILDQKVEVKAKSKIGSTANIKHVPGGGDKKIETQKIDFTASAKSKVGSMDNVKHVAAGGDIKVRDEKLSWDATSKVGSLDNVKHAPGGGKVQVRDEKLSWEVTSKVGSLDNVKHAPGGGKVQIFDEKVEFAEKADSKVGSMDKVKHQPGGGDKKIETQKLHFKETAKSRTNTGVGSGGEKRRSATSSRSESVASQGSSGTQD